MNNNSFLIISSHDYRSDRKAGIHFMSAEFAKHGLTRFYSPNFSIISKIKSDPRKSLSKLTGMITVEDEIECYLEKTLLPPFNMRHRSLRYAEHLLFSIYLKKQHWLLRKWIREATVIIFESGFPIIFFEMVKQLNPLAKTVYIASDDLSTIKVAKFVKNAFNKAKTSISAICVKSKLMNTYESSAHNHYVIPHGFDFNIEKLIDHNPYESGLNAISVGSMLFDATFFETAAKMFPKINFHIIGHGSRYKYDNFTNIHVYDEIPYRQTIPFIKYADFGIAAYRNAGLSQYLADTSLKLAQYSFFGIPSVCPTSICANMPGRFGYEPGKAESIQNAINAALSSKRFEAIYPQSWGEIVDKIKNILHI